MKNELESDILEGAFSKNTRISIKINKDLAKLLKHFLSESQLTKTELIESIIVEVKLDVLDHPKKNKIEELKRTLLASASVLK